MRWIMHRLKLFLLALSVLYFHVGRITSIQDDDELNTDVFEANQGISIDNVKQFSVSKQNDTDSDLVQNNVDTNGYILYCPCMGRFGNQADQLLGSLAFAKGLNRTLVLPPWIIYPPSNPFTSEQVEFSRWFSVKNLRKYHKVIGMEEFMKELAPKIWPKGKRYGFCYMFRNGKSCGMKDGNPFGPFWDHFDINFDGYFEHRGILWGSNDESVAKEWLERFPVSQYLVMAFQGAPGDYPSLERNQAIQKYIKFSDHINSLSDKFIIKEMKGEAFVAVHLRNGGDMVNVCNEIKKQDIDKLFCSEQCTGYRNKRKLTYEMCAPSKKEIIRKVEKYLKKLETKRLFIGSDHDSMADEFKKAFKNVKVSIHRREAVEEADHAIVDIAIMSKATYFIGNCVSSFTAFVRRQRESAGKPVDFFESRKCTLKFIPSHKLAAKFILRFNTNADPLLLIKIECFEMICQQQAGDFQKCESIFDKANSIHKHGKYSPRLVERIVSASSQGNRATKESCDISQLPTGEIYVNQKLQINSSNWDDCKQFIIEERIVHARLHCIDVCYRDEHCRSINYQEIENGKLKCVLFNAPSSELFPMNCLDSNPLHVGDGFNLVAQEDVDIVFDRIKEVTWI
eukprot:gene15908-17508_t